MVHTQMLDSYKANRNTTYCISIFIICYIFLLLIASAPHSAFDSFWHLQMGKDLLENGLSPWIDHYSFTYYGKEITEIPVIFQALLASFVSTFGESNGFYFFKVFYVTLLMFFLYVYFRQVKASWYIVFLALPFITYFITLRLIIRPEIISYVLMVICLSLYLKARESFKTRELLSICLLLLFWVNYHSPIFGYIIIFSLFLDRAIHKFFYDDCDFSWRQWFVWGGIIFLIGFIKPSGQHFLIASLSLLTSEFGQYTAEYFPSNTFYSMDKIVYLSWILSFYTMVVSLIKKQYGFAFIAIFLVYFSWSTARMVTPVAIINFCILGFLLSQFSYSQLSSALKPSIRNSLLLISVSLPLMAFYILTRSTMSIIEDRNNKSEILNKRYPKQVVDYLKNYQPGGNILNLMASGGYLINKLSPDFKVFIDGRTNILYPIEFFKISHSIDILTYGENNKVNSDVLNSVLENYDVHYAVYPNTPGRLLMFYGTDELNLNFADENFLLFSKNKKISFPVSSQLMVFPMCWNEALSISIQKEISLADTLFSNKSYALKSVLLFLKGYLSQNDKSKFLGALNPTDLSLDLSRRLAAYVALNSHEYSIALKYFASIRKQNEHDLLMTAYSLIKTEDYYAAENMLFYFYSKNKYPKKITISYEKIAIFSQLLKIIQEHYELKQFLPTYRDELEDKLKQANYNNGVPLESAILYQDYCKSFL